MDRETKVPKSIQVLQVEKLDNSCIKMSEEMDFYHKYVAPLLLYFFFWDDVVERGYFLFSTNFLRQINLSNFRGGRGESWATHYLNNDLSNKRKGSKSRTAGLDHVPE